jgi:hypothetical protein
VIDSGDPKRPDREQTITLVRDGAFIVSDHGRQQQLFLEMDMGTVRPHRLSLKAR